MDEGNEERELEYQPEDGLPYIPPPSGPSPDELRHQAKSLRRVSGDSIRRAGENEAPAWAKLMAVLFFGLIISGAVYALIFEAPRRQLAMEAGQLWTRLAGQEEGRLLRLPPPSRQASIRQYVQGEPMAHFSVGGSDSSGFQPPEFIEPDGILYYNLTPEQALAQASGQAGPASAASAAPPEKTPDAVAAFEYLKESSEAARKLAEGEVAGYEFKEWRPVRNTPPRYLINLVAADSQGREVSLVWQVDMEKQEQRAMSQQARELAAQFQ